MKVLIYYFTGTGNSLLVARKIAQRLEGTMLRPVMELIGTKENEVSDDSILLDTDAVGFVFPIYFDGMPEIIRKTIEKSHFLKTKYIFTVTTSGEGTGNALYEMDSLLRSRGVRLDYGKNVVLADNSIILRTSQTELEKRLIQIDEAADEIAAAVINLTRNDVALQRRISLSILGRINKFAVVHYHKAEKRMVDRTRCNRCGLCVKLCPVENILMTEGEVKIGDHCQWCFACLNWCPQKAIKFGRIDPSKKHQYRCPGMKASDIWRITL